MKLTGPVVVIDDDKDDQEILVEALERIGFNQNIRLFDSCPAALEYLASTSERPFIILCDINLPVMNGLEFRRTINGNEYLRRKSIPFVFLSTAAVKAQVVEAYDLTVQGFFVKNFSMDDIEKTLRRVLEYWSDCVHPNAVQ